MKITLSPSAKDDILISKSALKEDSIPWRNAFPEMEDQNIPAVCLKAARVREELTQQKLAEKSGIKQNHISEMENGKRTIGIEFAKKLAAALNTDYRVFL